MSTTPKPPSLLKDPSSHPFGLRTIMEIFDIGRGAAIATMLTTMIVIVMGLILFVHSAPPTHLTIATGPEGSTFQKNAIKYAKILERNGVKLNILTSDGSLQNLKLLADPKSHVDIGIVQAGITNTGSENLVSLGSISYQPLMLFYRGKPRDLLSSFAGGKIAVGPDGSGARKFALSLLALNGIKEGGTTTLYDWEAEEAAKALLDKKIDAAFVMSESASSDIMHNLLHSNEVQLFSFKQANAYSRKVDFLNILDLPEGSIDFGLNIPSHDIILLGPMVELVATKNLHPALSDLLLEAAVEVHNRPGTFQHRGDFPAAIEHLIPMSEDATRYFKSGKSLLYRYLPFWLASLTSRIVVIFLPLLVILIPVFKSIPAVLRWRIQTKIRRRYRELLTLEQAFLSQVNAMELEQLRHDFDRIEEDVNKMKIPASFADQFYGLRGHIDFVRGILAKRMA